jgi:hypothetical protein
MRKSSEQPSSIKLQFLLGFSIKLNFGSGDGDYIILKGVCQITPDYMALHDRRETNSLCFALVLLVLPHYKPFHVDCISGGAKLMKWPHNWWPLE